MEVIVPLGLMAGMFYLIYFMVKKNMQQIEQNFEFIAKRFAVEMILPESRWGWFLGKFPSIDGQINGLAFVSYMYTKGKGKKKKTYTAFIFRLENRVIDSLHLYKEGFWAKVGKTFGRQDIQFGDEAFDNAYIVRSDDERFAEEVFDRPMRQLLLHNLPRLRGEFKMQYGQFEYHELITLNTQTNRDHWLKAIKVGQQLVEKIESIENR